MTGPGRSEEPEDLSASLAATLIETYERFSALQGQKLLMANYVLERQSEIDDPATATRSILVERYSHLDPEKIDEVLSLVPSAITITETDGRTERGPGLGLDSSIADVLRESDEILGPGYGQVCVVAYLQNHLSQTRGGHTDDLRGSLFTGLIADFESFMVSFLTDLYVSEPRSLASKEKSVSWAQLFSIEDLAGFREELIDQVVLDTMRGSFEDWMAALKKDHGVSVAQYTDSPLVVEMFQRRHVLIHNGGRVSRLYVEKCPKLTVERGEKLTVSQEYFLAAANLLAVIALALTVNALFKVGGADKMKTEGRMTDWVYELLLRRRYQAVYDYLEGVPLDRMTSQSSREICQVNLWLGLKRLGRFDECRAEVEAWQVSHLDERFQLARHALLGNIEEAAKLSRSLRDSEKISFKHWVEWPMLEEVRQYEAEQAGVQEHRESDKTDGR